jgi:putative transposase
LAAKRFIRKAFARHGRPERIVIDGSQTNHEAIIACDGESRLRNRSRRLLKRLCCNVLNTVFVARRASDLSED